MSGLNRKLQRAAFRERFDDFTRAWRNEKSYQQFLLNSEDATLEEKILPGGRKVKIIKFGEKEMELLGKKPSFGVWMRSVKNAPRSTTVSNEKKVEVTDTEW